MLEIISLLVIFQLLIVSCTLGIISIFLFSLFENAFLYNPYINSVIVFSFVLGILICISKIIRYELEYRKLLKFDTLSKHDLNCFSLLKPITLYIKQSNKIVSQSKLQIIIAGVDKKVDDSLHTSKYIASILIFLGLFGTFWGLSKTIGNVSTIIDTLGIEQVDASLSFLKLKNSLKIPLEGMGIAFGCSLFGLLGSLILGFFNLNQKKVADKFLDKVEMWLSKYAVNISSSENNQEYHGKLFSMGLLEKTIEAIYTFQHQMNDLDENRVSLYNMQKEVNQKLSDLSDSILKHQNLIKILGENQLELQKAVVTFSTNFSNSIGREFVMKLSAIETSLNTIIQNALANRDYIVNNLGSDVKLVSKTLSSLIRE